MIAENTLAAILLCVVGIPGLYLNLLTSLSLLGASTPFELICACHAAGDAAIIAVMVFWSAPMILLNFPSISEGEIGRTAGKIIMYAWFLIHYTQVILAINRLVAIRSFTLYKAVFSIANTRKLLTMLSIYLLWYFFIGFVDGCRFIFHPTTWQWTFEMTRCGLILGVYLDFYFTIGLLLMCTAFDVCTAASLYLFLKKTTSGNRHFNHNDVHFFIQSCVSNFVFIIDLACFFVGPIVYEKVFGSAPGTFGTFLINTFTMEISHSLDGLIMVLFNSNTRKYIFSPRHFIKNRLDTKNNDSRHRVSDIARAYETHRGTVVTAS